MGADIHTVAERRGTNKWVEVRGNYFKEQDYARFGFWANVRNYAQCPLIVPDAPRGLPKDFDAGEQDEYGSWDRPAGAEHSYSWLTVKELVEFDYGQMMTNMRVENPEGERMTFREFLGPWYFKELDRLVASGAERIVFGFDC